MKGDKEYFEKYYDATYFFASFSNKGLFKRELEKYIPRYGTFNGYAVIIGKLRPVDPSIYQIRNGRLILQHIHESFDLFIKDLNKSIFNADKKWLKKYLNFQNADTGSLPV